MAIVKVVRAVPVIPVIEKVVLELTEQEAHDLRWIVGSIGGHYELSPRKTLSDIWSALADAGIEGTDGFKFRNGAVIDRE